MSEFRTGELLRAIKSLKRASGVENHSTASDRCMNGICYVHTYDKRSAQLFETHLKRATAELGIDHEIKICGNDFAVFQVQFPVTERTCKAITEKIREERDHLASTSKAKPSR